MDDLTLTTPEVLKSMNISTHISPELRSEKIDKYCVENIDLSKLSASNTKAIFKDEHGKYYLEVSGQHVTTEKITDNFYISHSDKWFLIVLNSNG